MEKKKIGKKGIERPGYEEELADEANRKDRLVRKQKASLPDGAMPAEELQEVLARQDGKKSESKIIDLASRRPVKAESVHSGPSLPKLDVENGIFHTEPEPETAGGRPPEVEEKKEIKLPRYFFEITLASAIEKIYIMANRGLGQIREIKSGKKEWRPGGEAEKQKIIYGILNKIPEVKADDEQILAEIRRLKSIQVYNVEELREKINSDPDIIKIIKSNKSETEKQKDLKNEIKEKLLGEVRRFFKKGTVAHAGEAVRIALYLESCVRRKLVEIVDSTENNPTLDEKKETFMYRTGPTPETSAREPLTEESDEEKIARLEERIQSEEFNDDERRYIDRIIKDYAKDVYEAKKNIEDGGGVVGDKWIDVFRTSHIEKCKTWGSKRQLAPEKAELLGKYLELKLPHGLPPEKPAEDPEKNENIFSGEKSSEFLRLLKVASRLFKEWLEQSEEWEEKYRDEALRKKMLLEQLQVALTGLMAKDPELKKHFPEENASQAIERVINHIKQFNNIK